MFTVLACSKQKATDNIEQKENKIITYRYIYNIIYQNSDTFQIVSENPPLWVGNEGAIFYSRPNERERIYHYGVRRWELVSKEAFYD